MYMHSHSRKKTSKLLQFFMHRHTHADHLCAWILRSYAISEETELRQVIKLCKCLFEVQTVNFQIMGMLALKLYFAQGNIPVHDVEWLECPKTGDCGTLSRSSPLLWREAFFQANSIWPSLRNYQTLFFTHLLIFSQFALQKRSPLVSVCAAFVPSYCTFRFATTWTLYSLTQSNSAIAS